MWDKYHCIKKEERIEPYLYHIHLKMIFKVSIYIFFYQMVHSKNSLILKL